MRWRKVVRGLSLGVVCLGGTGCLLMEAGTEPEPRTLPPLVQTAQEPPGPNCELGGAAILTGSDRDGDGILSPDEVVHTAYVCSARVDGLTTLVETSPEPQGEACAAGGLRIETGRDLNDDGVLAQAEVESSEVVCHGERGTQGIPGKDGADVVLPIPEPPGANCMHGGVQLITGVDEDGSGELEDSEFVSVYVCNARVDGYTTLVDTEPQGPTLACPAGGVLIKSGRDLDEDGELAASEIEHMEAVCHGERGTDGRDGIDGYTSLVETTAVAPDPQGACYFGGSRIDTGLDLDRDGVLDPGEVESTRHICSTQTNEQRTLVDSSLEPPGVNCPHGGVKMTIGYDDDGYQTLDAPEIDATSYMCNQVVVINGEDGRDSLIENDPATANQCPAGGYVLRSGLDDDADGVLDPVEVTSTEVICNGVDGLSALVETRPYNGNACGQGVLGYDIVAGRDIDRDGVLDANEIENQTLICDGQDGFEGYNGRDSLIRTSGDNGVCPYGGFTYQAGLDANADGVLDGSEVTSTEVVCNGYDGLNSLVELSQDNSVCFYDGYRVDVGLDANNDGVLGFSEIENTAYVCDGFNGLSSLVDVVVDPFECPFTGVRFDTGLDLDDDGILDASEIQNSTVLCD